VFEPPSGPGIRLDSGVTRGSIVSYHFDPLLGKLIVWAPTRAAAIDRMKRALDDFVLLGVRNNIDFLRRVISTGDFMNGKLDTGFLDRHRELFETGNTIPAEVFLVASVGGAPSSNQATFNDVWNSGPWRNA